MREATCNGEGGAFAGAGGGAASREGGAIAGVGGGAASRFALGDESGGVA